MQKVEIGSKISKYRKNLNLSQKELADKLNVSSQLISKWETDTSVPSIEYLIELSKIFQIDLNEFLNIEKQNGTKENNIKSKAQTFKNFLKQNYKILTAMFGAILLIVSSCCLLTCYVINPITINNNLNCIENKMLLYPVFNLQLSEEESYFNVEFKSYQNGEIKEKDCFQGYLENGKTNFKRTHNSSTYNLIVDNVTYYKNLGYKEDYKYSETIKNAKDLFFHYFNNYYNNNYEFEKKDFITLRKTYNGFYYELRTKAIQDILRESVKGIKVIGKVYGKITLTKNKINYMDLNITTYQKDIDEKNKFKSEIQFSYNKPNFKNEANTQLPWKVESTSNMSFLKSLDLGTINEMSIDEYNALYSKENFEYNNKLYVRKGSKINIYNSQTLEYEKNLSLPSSDNNIYKFNNYVIQIYNNKVYKLDLNTEQIKSIYSFTNSKESFYKIKDNILYLRYNNTNYSNSGYCYKIDLTTEKIEKLNLNYDIKFVYITNSYDLIYKENGVYKKYNSSLTFSIENCSFAEKDRFLYVYNLNDDIYTYYKYNDTEFLESFTSKNNIFEENIIYLDEEKTKYTYINDNNIYNSEDIVVDTIKDVYNKNNKFSPEFISKIGDKLITKFSNDYFTNFAIYKINCYDKPLSFINNTKEINFFKTNNYYFFYIDNIDSNCNYYRIKIIN